MVIDPLEEARVFLPASVEAWPDALAAMPHAEAMTLVRDLYKGWIDGALGTALFDDEGPITEIEADRRIGRMFLRLPGPLQVPHHTFEQSGDACRWCWAPGWALFSQDEDLELMNDACMIPLLGEARAGCPKRDYVFYIVGHHARDQAHAAVWMSPDGLGAVLDRVRPWIPAARAAEATSLTTYLERLVGYAEPQRVSREDAVTRVLDLRRCDPERHRPPEVTVSGRQWVARFEHTASRDANLHIDVETGRMWVEKPT